ncbi:hypothetical protein F5884DRAFT_489298 [Xylogone sp. PMI_703]|nr:hypothetical protein F5884DRAFT_489298 [Xylogone sp. PMI_703]
MNHWMTLEPFVTLWIASSLYLAVARAASVPIFKPSAIPLMNSSLLCERLSPSRNMSRWFSVCRLSPRRPDSL